MIFTVTLTVTGTVTLTVLVGCDGTFNGVKSYGKCNVDGTVRNETVTLMG